MGYCTLESYGYGTGAGGGFTFYGNGVCTKGDGTTTWVFSSDRNVKENIELANLDTCYDNIKNIPLKRFSYKDGVVTPGSDRMRLGWIAQEVQPVFPKAVVTIQAGSYGECLGLNVDQLNAALYGAVQKLIQKVEILEAKVKELSPP
jgi:hypothetical protein